MPEQNCYPSRPQFFCAQFARLLGKSAAVFEIGTDGFCLLMLVVHIEDTRRYKSPPKFFNAALCDQLGGVSVSTLDRIRQRCVAAGWLHYEPGKKRQAGTYWVTIPPELDEVSAKQTTSSLGMNEDETDDSLRTGAQEIEVSYAPVNRKEAGKSLSCAPVNRKAEGNRGGKRKETEDPSYPIPNPSPNRESARPSDLNAIVEYARGMDRTKYPAAADCAETFFDHYQANGWRQGQGSGRAIKDWQAAFRNWVRRQREFAPSTDSAPEVRAPSGPNIKQRRAARRQPNARD